VQKAYEVLSDPVQRKGYDSQFDFDDWIPKGTENLADQQAFFKLYGPVFESNARFSTIKPVPLLGTLDDPEPKVKAFYTFWRTFSSWRLVASFFAGLNDSLSSWTRNIAFAQISHHHRRVVFAFFLQGLFRRR